MKSSQKIIKPITKDKHRKGNTLDITLNGKHCQKLNQK